MIILLLPNRLRLARCLTLFFLLFLAAGPKQAVGQLRIMPLGNSITQANQYTQSYRYPLWKKLIDANIAFDFVGSMNSNKGGNPDWPDYKGKKFDRDHEGHWGWRADEILRSLEGWLNGLQGFPGYTPDIVLMHVGTNDAFQYQPERQTLAEIAQIVQTIRDKNPRVTILMAKLIPAEKPDRQARLDRVNAGIPALAKDLDTPESRVILVDQFSGYNASTDNHDGVHPGPSGEEKMAEKWFQAILLVAGPNEQLPIRLEHFSAALDQERVLLKWRTAAEENNAFFSVERSADGELFREIGQVPGAGNSQVPLSYSLTDQAPLPGTSYYRLKQTDHDGSASYSRIVPVSNQAKPISSLRVYPSPNPGDEVSIKGRGLPAEEEVLVTVRDILGRVVHREEHNTGPGGSIGLSLNLQPRLKAGTYAVTVIAGGVTSTAKLVVQ